jgi:hypothetical protein
VESNLLALKLVLNELGVEANIDTIDDRKRVQKAVYLAQLPGVDLGYRFGWYLRGPYSTDLTKDYYALAEATTTEGGVPERHLSDAARQRLQQVKPLVPVPAGVDLPQEDWLELVSSVHFLRRVAKLDREHALQKLQTEKPRLVRWHDAAEHALVQATLLQAA